MISIEKITGDTAETIRTSEQQEKERFEMNYMQNMEQEGTLQASLQAEENEIPIENKPHAEDIWGAMGGNHDNLTQALYEFIDNSISSIIGSKSKTKNISVNITDLGNKKRIQLEDTGAGISNLDAAFTLACKTHQATTLNEHGTGMKNALSFANTGNDSWSISTRTAEDLNSGVYKQISAPYSFDGFKATIKHQAWPGLYNQTGTIIRFDSSNETFGTIAKGRQGGLKLFDTLVEALIEDIGYTYAGLIKDGKATITVISTDINGRDVQHIVTPIEPVLAESYEPGTFAESCDLGGGTVRLEYMFGRINDKSNGRYYKRKSTSSGCEIRVNGRIMVNGLFKEIWDIDMHPSYNGFHVSVNIISDNLEALPQTKTSKNGFREGDKRLTKLYEEIRKKMTHPKKAEKSAIGETGIFTALADSKRKHMLNNPIINEEQRAFKSLGSGSVEMDLYIASPPDDVIIYEGKKAKSTPKDVYQLLMYWDGLLYDGIQPTEGILLASEHPDSVYELIKYIRNRSDVSGVNYNFKARTWEDEGMEHLLQNGTGLSEDGD